VQPSELGSKVKDLQANNANKMVYIKADARARFASVTDVIDNLRIAGVDQLGLITEPVQDKNRRSGM
jgi:biopolymer transport protein ExbD